MIDLTLIFKLLIIFISFGGFLLAFYIFNKKQTKKPMVCPLNGHCDTVVNSKYSSFLGVDLTVGGMAYYGLVAVVYAVLVVLGDAVPSEVRFFVTGISIGAFFFSLYLTFIQAFVLKSWCTWCLGSAFLTTLIAIMGVFGLPFDLIPLLRDYRSLIIILHALAAGIGVGVTTVTDWSFVKFLKDFRIDQLESKTMAMYSQILWLALGLLIVTGIGLYLPEAETLNQSSKFLLKVTVVGVITVNGLWLNIFVQPRLTKIAFDVLRKNLDSKARVTRRFVFASGAVSVLSWYLTFVLGMVDSIPFSYKTALLFYVAGLFIAVLASGVYEKVIALKAGVNTGQE